MMKKITLCGSMKFFDEMEQLQSELEGIGFEVLSPTLEGVKTDYAKMTTEQKGEVKQSFTDRHLAKIKDSDAILVVNYPKNGIDNYIGASAFLEMGFAYVLEKKIFLLNEVPEQWNSEEILWLRPVVLHGDIGSLQKLL